MTLAPADHETEVWNSTDGRDEVAGDARSSGHRGEWKSVPHGWRITAIVLAALVLIDLAVAAVDSLSTGASPAGPSGSSFSATGDGLGAMAQLLSRYGHNVLRLTTPIGASSLPAGAFLVVSDPGSWSRQQSVAVSNAVKAGHTLLLLGRPPAGLLPALFGRVAPEWSAPGLLVAAPVGNSSETFGVSSVRAGGGPGSWSSAGVGAPLLEGSGRVFALVERAGAGTATLVASSAPFENRNLGADDDAAFALDVAGAQGSPVVFDEYDHGYGRSGTGFASIPDHWKWGLGLLALAALVWLASASRRLGPARDPEREQLPPRVAYVDALATVLTSRYEGREPEATEPALRRARRLLCRRVGVAEDADDATISRAAEGALLPDGLLAAVLSAPTSEQEVLALGRALSSLESRSTSAA
jgi:hypothetical protein